jgi:hypothetical protein
MPGVPWSPHEDGKCENEYNNDDRQRSAADRAIPVMSIAHTALLSDHLGNALSA